MNIDDPILRAGSEISNVPNLPADGVDKPKQPNRFMSVLKTIGGVAASFVPGLGGIVGGALSGGPDFGSMQAMIQQQQKSSMQMLGIQNQVSTQAQNFTTVSNLLKARHDSEMSAVNNFKS
ncbi:MAG: hypothetical protein ABI954_05290 [Pyrinomonadaceae bacterium]